MIEGQLKCGKWVEVSTAVNSEAEGREAIARYLKGEGVEIAQTFIVKGSYTAFRYV